MPESLTIESLLTKIADREAVIAAYASQRVIDVREWVRLRGEMAEKDQAHAEKDQVVSEERMALLKELSDIETIVIGLSPPNFKGQGEVVTLVEKVEWMARKIRGIPESQLSKSISSE